MSEEVQNELIILLIEADASYTEFTKMILETELPGEVRVECVGSMAKSVVAFNRGEVGLVVADLGLPDSEGISTFRKLIQLTAAPIIVLTAEEDDDLGAQVVKEGAQDYLLKKSNNGASMVRAIRYALERKHLAETNKKTIKELVQANVRHEKTLRKLEKLNEEFSQEIEFRKAAEASQFLLATAIEQSFENVVITDPKGYIQYVNPSFVTLTGYSRAEAIGAHTRILKSGHQPSEFYLDLWGTILRGKVWKGRMKNKGKDGSLFEVESTISPVFGAEGEITNFVGVIRDITREADLEYRLMQSQKLESIDQLAAGIAHEINTPAQYVGDNIRFMEEALTTMSQMMNKYDELCESVKEQGISDELKGKIDAAKEELDIEFFVEEIPVAIKQSIDGVGRISSIVQAMKNFSHPGSEDMSPADLGKAIESTVTVARNEWKYVADLKLDLEENLPLVPCYLGEFNQAILNMIVNSAHAIESKVGSSGEKGTIAIATRLDDDFALIEIRDTGCGIPKEIRNRIFEPFFTTKEVGKGTGQGMAIAYSTIIDKHKGTIHLDSEVDVGTTIRIRLPLTTPEERYSTFDGLKQPSI